MDKEYRSVEGIICDKLLDITHNTLNSRFVTGFSKFIYGGARGFYGALATPLRVPTFIRKNTDWQGLVAEHVGSNAEVTGIIIGGLLGVGLWGAGVVTSSTELFKDGNYLPATVLAGTLLTTNILSGTYELGRRNVKNKLERQVSYNN